MSCMTSQLPKQFSDLSAESLYIIEICPLLQEVAIHTELQSHKGGSQTSTKVMKAPILFAQGGDGQDAVPHVLYRSSKCKSGEMHGVTFIVTS